MSETKKTDLKAGEFYGIVACRRKVSDFLISEISHFGKRDLPRHSHRSAYFSLLIDGSYSESYAGKSFDYKPLTVWWHRPGIMHKDEVGTNGGRFLNLEIGDGALDDVARNDSVREDFYERNSELTWLACRLLKEMRGWQPCSTLVAENLALEMSGFAIERQACANVRSRPAWLGTVVEKVTDEFTAVHRSADLAAAAGVHPIHMAAVFRRFYKQTVGEYVRGLKVKKAAELLLLKDVPLVEVAMRVGFADQSHLSRNFKRSVGMTPGEFRLVLTAFRDAPAPHSR
jgi:AraC family transcriptional regulator